MSWYVLYTFPRAEKRVAARLKDLDVEVFLPLHKKRKKWSDRMKMVEVPLFNSYIFVKCNDCELYSLLKGYGVLRIIYYLHRPAIVRECEIEAIKEFLRIAENKKIIYAGDKVEIVSGAFQNKCCKVLKVEKSRVTLFLEELGAKIYVSLSEVDKLQPEVDGLKHDTNVLSESNSRPESNSRLESNLRPESKLRPKSNSRPESDESKIQPGTKFQPGVTRG